jgi:hypothetical protein
MTFTQKADRTKEILSLVHTETCGSLSTPARGGFEYFTLSQMIVQGMVMFT